MTRLNRSFRRSAWHIVTYSWINVLLVFVPVGIGAAYSGVVHGGVVFALNCLALVPLSALLAHATETVSSGMGDALGALMNVTFGNAVELVLLCEDADAERQNKIRIVQASLLGSILANLLLILGMCFLLGGLRYQEQLYNPTITQMSACLLSLSVISLVLPTTFHAAFRDNKHAEEQSLKISRGTSVILLVVYAIFVFFQLKSHAHLYESMPRHIVDAEATPGPAATWLDPQQQQQQQQQKKKKEKEKKKKKKNRSSSASDSDSDSDSSDPDSDSCRCSDTDCPASSRDDNDLGRRVRRGSRSARGRRPGSSSGSGAGDASRSRSSSVTVTNTRPATREGGRVEGDGSDPWATWRRLSRTDRKKRRKDERRRRRPCRGRRDRGKGRAEDIPDLELPPPQKDSLGTSPVQLGRLHPFHDCEGQGVPGPSSSRMIPLRRLRGFTPASFLTTSKSDGALGDDTPRLHGGEEEEESRQFPRRPLPLTLTLTRHSHPAASPVLPAPRSSAIVRPNRLSARTMVGGAATLQGYVKEETPEEKLGRPAALALIAVATVLVVLCAESLVSSIEEVTRATSMGETFVGLIILPIVGNAAEHITSIAVAMRNKMDLAIGVSIGSSIQISLLVTPLVVILGWALGRDMSLYFPLFETMCLFLSAFIVNFLVLDGRSNYMEGALLCAVYLIIGVVAFFYPEGEDANEWEGGGGVTQTVETVKMLLSR
ncbi:Ca2+:H+ antiporter [Geosmithia morbida]|uniref:Ca2+:H+ antiporter n=1 Tax=Geosmithia morbida TaxID=1094350 RepID=A0A9P5D2H2_9HYPO|nr:Ca2+:H+ antiporter [Geosmithia morbida]KAF4125058.1 Ca2+:H+ antiporter [Geosmithia morbida]